MLKYGILGSLIGAAIVCALIMMGVVVNLITHSSNPYVAGIAGIILIAAIVGGFMGCMFHEDGK